MKNLEDKKEINAVEKDDSEKAESNKTKNNKNKEKSEVKTMTKTMKINGMMCGHCEATVKKSLEALPEVEEAVVSHEAGTAVLTLRSDISDEVLIKTVQDSDYEVVSVD